MSGVSHPYVGDRPVSQTNPMPTAGTVAGTKGTPTTFAVAVAVTATLIVAANAGRIIATFRNNGTARVYLGNTNAVTTSAPLYLDPGDEMEDENTVAAWYGIVASGTGAVGGIEVA